MVSSMGPNEWDCSVTCLAKLDMWLLVLNAYLCSLNLVAKFCPVCPTYALLQSGQVNLYAPEQAYLSGGLVLWPISYTHNGDGTH